MLDSNGYPLEFTDADVCNIPPTQAVDSADVASPIGSHGNESHMRTSSLISSTSTAEPSTFRFFVRQRSGYSRSRSSAPELSDQIRQILHTELQKGRDRCRKSPFFSKRTNDSDTSPMTDSSQSSGRSRCRLRDHCFRRRHRHRSHSCCRSNSSHSRSRSSRRCNQAISCGPPRLERYHLFPPPTCTVSMDQETPPGAVLVGPFLISCALSLATTLLHGPLPPRVSIPVHPESLDLRLHRTHLSLAHCCRYLCHASGCPQPPVARLSGPVGRFPANPTCPSSRLLGPLLSPGGFPSHGFHS